jgi:hypothetical protein
MLACASTGGVCLCVILFYGWKHRPFEALIPAVPIGHPLASACCCSGIVTIAIATTPSNLVPLLLQLLPLM